jgi:hypothetical protein
LRCRGRLRRATGRQRQWKRQPIYGVRRINLCRRDENPSSPRDSLIQELRSSKCRPFCSIRLAPNRIHRRNDSARLDDDSTHENQESTRLAQDSTCEIRSSDRLARGSISLPRDPNHRKARSSPLHRRSSYENHGSMSLPRGSNPLRHGYNPLRGGSNHPAGGCNRDFVGSWVPFATSRNTAPTRLPGSHVNQRFCCILCASPRDDARDQKRPSRLGARAGSDEHSNERVRGRPP